MSRHLRRYRAMLPLYLAIIFGVPTFVAFGPIVAAPEGWARFVAVAVAPILFAVVLPLVAGLLARLTLDAIVPGKFARDLGQAPYGRRRLYGICWTAVYYCPPIYHAVLSVPWLKRATFRLFGYRGSLDVTIQSDTWLRDLPLLDLGEGAYLSNKATIGTNICMPDGTIVVGPVHVGRQAMIGHAAIIGPGAVLGDRVEVGIGTGIGIRARIGARTIVGPWSLVYHGVRIGTDCHIGAACHIGTKATIGDGLSIPFGTLIPPRTAVRTAGDVARLSARAPVSPSFAGSPQLDLD
jgi:carbonic anhydrase/acetyltransferase-like protein (isoleucine patch superfamily)